MNPTLLIGDLPVLLGPGSARALRIIIAACRQSCREIGCMHSGLDNAPEIHTATAQQLRNLICDSVEQCTVKGCPHCRTIARAIGKIDGPRVYAAGAGYVACPKHGVQIHGHQCDWRDLLIDHDAHKVRGGSYADDHRN